MKSASAQWIVRPHPAPLNEGVGSRSKMSKVGVGGTTDDFSEALLRRDCARSSPVIPAPIIRTWGVGFAFVLLSSGVDMSGSGFCRFNHIMSKSVCNSTSKQNYTVGNYNLTRVIPIES